MTVMNSINKSKNILTVIDIGNSKVSCLIGTPVKNNNVQVIVLGFGQHASLGISNGQVIDMKEIANSYKVFDYDNNTIESDLSTIIGHLNIEIFNNVLT